MPTGLGFKRTLLALVVATAMADLCTAFGHASTLTTSPSPPEVVNADVGSAVCAACHADIARSYATTPMAMTSGIATSAPSAGSFHSDAAKVDYGIVEENREVFFTYDRAGSPPLHGRQRLAYFFGSGRRGRSYAFDIDGYLFQAPVSYYAQAKRWDVSPGDADKHEMPVNRPIEAGCLACHASRLQPIAGTENRYASPAFAENGISCERCHGPGAAHSAGHGNVINPSKLSADRRDSICAQCHLTGEARIDKPGRHFEAFRPGDLLSDYVSYFVYDTRDSSGLRAVSHVQALDQSVCKTRSGDRMSCMSCHDPHASPPPDKRAEYFRARCLACHEQEKPSAAESRHFASNFDCASCHMPKSSSVDVDHTAVTDHRIERKPSRQRASWPDEQVLRGLTRADADERDLGLAYARLAARVSDPFPSREAFSLLNKALPLNPKDAAVTSALGYLYQQRGDIEKAAALYEAALESDPGCVEAAVNLGAIYGSRGRLNDAIRLWEDALRRNAGLSEAGVDLAIAKLRTGDAAGARRAIASVLTFNPDFGAARELLHAIDASSNAAPRVNATH